MKQLLLYCIGTHGILKEPVGFSISIRRASTVCVVAALSSSEVANLICHCEDVVGAVSTGSWKESFEPLRKTYSCSVREERHTFSAFTHDRPNRDDSLLGRGPQSTPGSDRYRWSQVPWWNRGSLRVLRRERYEGRSRKWNSGRVLRGMRNERKEARSWRAGRLLVVRPNLSGDSQFRVPHGPMDHLSEWDVPYPLSTVCI